jgi:hypothetical protein
MNLIKSPLSALLNKAGVPTLANGGTPPTPAPTPAPKPRAQAPLPPSAFRVVLGGTSGIPDQYTKYEKDPFAYLGRDSVIDAYRANPKNKFGAKDYIETQPTALNSAQITAYMKALRDAQHFGVKPLTPEQLVTMALVEGRSDLGYNMFNYNNPKALKMAETLSEAMGHNPDAAGFAAAVLDKQMQSQRLNIPFTTLWNGTGRGRGGTGADYTRRYNEAYNTGAYEHPKNALLYEAIANGLMPDPVKATMPQVDAMGNPLGFKDGGHVSKQKAFLKFKKK